jgi:hypothetical protein
MESEWEIQADYLGYPDVETMMRDLYLNKQLSIGQVARRLGMGTATVTRKLRQFDISTRRRGGPNRYPQLFYKLHLIDQRFVFGKSTSAVSGVLRMSLSYVYKYKTRVKGVTYGAFQPDSPDVDDDEVSDG